MRSLGIHLGRLLLVLCLASSCAESEETYVDLAIVHAVTIAFQDMAPDVPEQAVVALDDLRSEPDYVRHLDRFVCASVEPDESFLAITRLAAPGLETVLGFTLDISPHGADQWTPLWTYTGLVVDQEVVPASDEDATLDDGGRTVLQDLVLGDPPLYDIRITAEVPNQLEDLSIDLQLTVSLSSELGHCP